MSYASKLRDWFCRIFKCKPTPTPTPVPTPTPTPVPTSTPTPSSSTSSVSDAANADASASISVTENSTLTDKASASDAAKSGLSGKGSVVESGAANDVAASAVVPWTPVYVPAVAVKNVSLLSYKNATPSELMSLATVVSKHMSTDNPLSTTYYKPVVTGNTFLADMLSAKFTDYVFGLMPQPDGSNQVLFGGGYTVNADLTVNVFQHLFVVENSDSNLYAWMLLNSFLASAPTTSLTANNTFRFTFQATNAPMLAWFQQKAAATVSVGRQYPDVLRSFLLRSPTAGWYETVTTYTVLKAYSKLTQIPMFFP